MPVKITKISALLLALLLITGCKTTTNTTQDLDVDLDDNENQVEITTAEFTTTRANTNTIAVTELQDDTGYNFAYSANNVLDLDYSTAWCSATNDNRPLITLDFGEATSLEKIGIVPGFARDEKIFNKNNRLRTVTLLGQGSEELQQITFSDSYGMQFFDVEIPSVKQLGLRVDEVFEGSKYNDTCIAEIDLWSDWVKQKDSQAAYNYYLKNKEAFALRPVSLSSMELIFANPRNGINQTDLLTACGAIDTNVVNKEVWDGGYTYVLGENPDDQIIGDEYLGNYNGAAEFGAAAGQQPLLSAGLSGDAKIGDKFEVRWYKTSFFMELPEKELLQTATLEPKECSDGRLYLSDSLSSPEATLGGFEVYLYYGDRLIGKRSFNMAQ